MGNPISGTDPSGTSPRPSGTADLLEEVDAEARKRSYTYNAAGNPLTVAGPDGSIAKTMTYTDDGQPATQRNADGSVLTYTYDPDTGRPLGATGPKGRTLSYGYDTDGRINKVTDNAGTTSLTRDGAGNILTVDDPSHQLTRYTYDAFDRPLTLTDPSGKTSTWTYTPEGNLARTTDGTGAAVTYNWDAANRLTATRTPASATSPQPDVIIGHTYDKAGVVTGVNAPAGPVQYGYDGRGRLANVRSQALGEFTFGFDKLDRLSTLTRPNTVNDTLAWDGQDLASRNATKGTTVLGRAEYAVDTIGRRTSLTDTGGVHNYTRNARGQLTGVDHPGIRADETHGWDPLGNRTADATSPQGTNTTGPSARLMAAPD